MQFIFFITFVSDKYVCGYQMEMNYNVAGLAFGLSVPDCFPVLELIDNYKPFEQTAPEHDELIFNCAICDTLPEDDFALYYREQSVEEGMPQIDIFRSPRGYLFEMRPHSKSERIFRLWTSEDFSKGMLLRWDLSGIGRFPLDNALMLMFAFRTASMSTLEMHASVIVKDNMGYLFLGKSGTGKSTHSRMWLDNIPGSMLLNDDNPVVRVLPDGQIRVYGTPWSGKTPCYKNLDFHVGGFVQIVQYPENLIERQRVIDAYVSLYSSCSGMNVNSGMTDVLHATLETVIASVPCWQLKCLPNGDAARVCFECVKNGYDTVAE